MIEVLNKKSKSVLSRTNVYVPYIRFTSDRAINFNAGAMEMCGLKSGMYVHFVILHKTTWCIKVNTDPTGFKLSNTTDKGSNVRIHAQGIIRLFKEAFNHELPNSFYLQQNKGATHDGEKIYEILAHKPIPKNIKTNY